MGVWDHVEAGATRMVRWQDRTLARYRHGLRKLRWIGKMAWRLFLITWLGLGAMYWIAVGVEWLGWHNPWISTARIDAWLSQEFEWVNYLPDSAMVFGFLVPAMLLGAFLLWSVPRLLATRRGRRKEVDKGLLREAVAEVPTREDMVYRFLIVLVASLIMITVLRLVGRWFGYCFLPVDDTCDDTTVTFVLTRDVVAAGLGLVSILGMYQARAKRATARRKLKSVISPRWYGLVDTFRAMLLGITILAAVSWLLFVLGTHYGWLD